VKSWLSASAIGAHSADDHGVPWQNTTGGPAPRRLHRTSFPRQMKVSFTMPAPSQLDLFVLDHDVRVRVTDAAMTSSAQSRDQNAHRWAVAISAFGLLLRSGWIS
jgi:hypothetical protein